MPDTPKPLMVRLSTNTRTRLEAYVADHQVSRRIVVELALKRYLAEEAPLDERIAQTGPK